MSTGHYQINHFVNPKSKKNKFTKNRYAGLFSSGPLSSSASFTSPMRRTPPDVDTSIIPFHPLFTWKSSPRKRFSVTLDGGSFVEVCRNSTGPTLSPSIASGDHRVAEQTNEAGGGAGGVNGVRGQAQNGDHGQAGNDDGLNGSAVAVVSRQEHVRLFVRSFSNDDPGVEYCLNVNESMDFVYQDYALKLDYHPSKIILHWHGVEVNPDDTPVGLGMSEIEHVTVFGKEPNMNLDTRYKVFAIQEADDIPIELSLRCKKTVDMDRIFRVWAEHINEIHHRVVLVRKSRIKSRIGLLDESGILNGDRLFSLVVDDV